MPTIIVFLLSALFAIQDFFHRLLHIEPAAPTAPPMLPGSRAARDGGWGYIPSRHNELLFYRYWLPPDPLKARAWVIAVHGLGAHGQHFWVLGKYLADRGIVTHALDLRGHGYSEGPRGDLSQSDTVVDGIIDLAHFVVGGSPHRPLFILGESYGSDLVMLAAARDDPSIHGVILAGTAVAPTEQATGGRLLATLAEYARYSPYLLFNSRARVIDITGREERVTRDKEQVERSKTDPLRNNRQSPRTFVETYRVITQILDTARRLHVPTLLLQGGHDLVTQPEAVWKLHDALGTDDATVVIFTEAYHGLFFDPDTPKVMATIAAWLDSHIAQATCQR